MSLDKWLPNYRIYAWSLELNIMGSHTNSLTYSLWILASYLFKLLFTSLKNENYSICVMQ